jgi:hypothetical protein
MHHVTKAIETLLERSDAETATRGGNCRTTGSGPNSVVKSFELQHGTERADQEESTGPVR